VGRPIAEVLIRLKWNADQRRDGIGKFLGQFGRFIGLSFDLRRIGGVDFSKTEEQSYQSRNSPRQYFHLANSEEFQSSGT